jgi:hypothetical protein
VVTACNWESSITCGSTVAVPLAADAFRPTTAAVMTARVRSKTSV